MVDAFGWNFPDDFCQAAHSHKQKTKLNQQRHEWIEQVPLRDLPMFLRQSKTRGYESKSGYIWLVVWSMFYFSILGIIIPIDFHIFQRVGSTTNQELLELPKCVAMIRSVVKPTQTLSLRMLYIGLEFGRP